MRSSKDARRNGRSWARRRDAAIQRARVSGQPTICPRCERPIDLDHDRIDLGHQTDYAFMAAHDQLVTRLEHMSCNRAAGWALVLEGRRPDRSGNRLWVSRGVR